MDGSAATPIVGETYHKIVGLKDVTVIVDNFVAADLMTWRHPDHIFVSFGFLVL